MTQGADPIERRKTSHIKGLARTIERLCKRRPEENQDQNEIQHDEIQHDWTCIETTTVTTTTLIR